MHDPIGQFDDWFKEALACGAIREPSAMVLATASLDAAPSARVVLLKSYASAGFTFYTNLQSRKADELLSNPQAALCFYWMPLDKQVRIEGSISRIDDATADDYFASRDRGKQVGAWASAQSQPMEHRAELEQKIAEIEKLYNGRDIPRPPHWSGFRLAPQRIEFWQQGEFRLHQRDIYTKADRSGWDHQLLYP